MRFRRVFSSAFFVLAAGMVFTATSFAAQLQPSKPSQLINLFGATGGPTCAGVNGLYAMQLQNPDGTRSPFVIPPKMVFIVVGGFLEDHATSVDFASLQVFDPVALAGTFVTGAYFPSGIGLERFELQQGVVMKPDKLLCVSHNAIDPAQPVAAIVRGYLTKDK